MTTTYKFKAGFTKGGTATSPGSAVTVDVMDVAGGSLVVTAGTPTAGTAAIPGFYSYSYTGTASMDFVAVFKTDDATLDQMHLHSYTPDVQTTNLDAKISSVGGGAGTSTLDYTLYDSGGTVVAGATVYLYSDSGRTALVTTKTTSAFGIASFTNLAAGTYYLTSVLSGYDDMNDTEVVA